PLMYDSDSENGNTGAGAGGDAHRLRWAVAGSSLADLEEAREQQLLQDLLDLRRGVAAFRLPTSSSGGQADRGFLYLRRLRPPGATGGSSGGREESRSSVRSKLSSRSADSGA